jgi:hypothetical protein
MLTKLNKHFHRKKDQVFILRCQPLKRYTKRGQPVQTEVNFYIGTIEHFCPYKPRLKPKPSLAEL